MVDLPDAIELITGVRKLIDRHGRGLAADRHIDHLIIQMCWTVSADASVRCREESAPTTVSLVREGHSCTSADLLADGGSSLDIHKSGTC
jgi:hypothetical protein